MRVIITLLCVFTCTCMCVGCGLSVGCGTAQPSLDMALRPTHQPCTFAACVPQLLAKALGRARQSSSSWEQAKAQGRR